MGTYAGETRFVAELQGHVGYDVATFIRRPVTYLSTYLFRCYSGLPEAGSIRDVGENKIKKKNILQTTIKKTLRKAGRTKTDLNKLIQFMD